MYNPINNSLVCDECYKVIRYPTRESRVKEDELCDLCYEKKMDESKFLDDYHELMDNINNGTKKSRRV
jgi:hypothetical protein